MLTRSVVAKLITSFTGGSEQAAGLYRQLLDGKLRLAPDAEYFRVALLQALRTIAEHKRPAGKPHGLALFDTCPDCSSPVFETRAVAVGEVRSCGCGTEWRRRPRHRTQETYAKMERAAVVQRTVAKRPKVIR